MRKGGTVNFFGGCPTGTTVSLDTGCIHYSNLRLLASFHHTPRTIRRALGYIEAGVVRADDFVDRECSLTRAADGVPVNGCWESGSEDAGACSRMNLEGPVPAGQRGRDVSPKRPGFWAEGGRLGETSLPSRARLAASWARACLSRFGAPVFCCGLGLIAAHLEAAESN